MATTGETKKEASGPVISGGHLVAKALKTEGVDTIFTLCGGHIIDIYDGCIDEGIRIIDVRHEQVAAHAADGYARQTGKLGCVVTTAGPGMHQRVTGIATAFRVGEPGAASSAARARSRSRRWAALQDLPHVDMMTPITKFAVDRDVAPNASPTWWRWRRANASTARPARRISRSRATCSTARVDAHQGRDPPAGRLPRLDQVDRRSGATSRSSPTFWSMPSGPAHSVRQAGLDLPRPQRGDRAAARPRHSRLLQRRRPRVLAAGRSASLRPHAPLAFDKADVIVIVGTPFDFRMGYGKRIAPMPTLVQIDMDYRTVGKNRDVELGIVGDPGAVLGAVLQAAGGAPRRRQRAGAPSG